MVRGWCVWALSGNIIWSVSESLWWESSEGMLLWFQTENCGLNCLNSQKIISSLINSFKIKDVGPGGSWSIVKKLVKNFWIPDLKASSHLQVRFSLAFKDHFSQQIWEHLSWLCFWFSKVCWWWGMWWWWSLILAFSWLSSPWEALKKYFATPT